MNWAQFTSLSNGTRVFNHGFDQCVALANLYHESVIGGSFVPVASAYQWWSNFNSYATLTSNYTRSSTPVAGAIFVARYGIYNGPHGHIGVVTGVNSNGTFNTMEQNAERHRYLFRYTRGMANILGFLIPKKNPANPPLQPTQRKVGANPVKRRASWTTSSAEKQPPLTPHGVANFNGWRYGEQVNDGVKNTNIWFRGISGDWFWAGGFTSQSTSGLTNLNPAKQPNQRQAKGSNINLRSAPNTSASIVGEVKANEVVTPEGWVLGERFMDYNLWYKIKGGYGWSGAFTQQSTSNLKDLNPKEDPVKPNQRQVKGDLATNVRSTPNASASITGSIPAGQIITPEGWVTGQNYGGISVWFKTPQGYVWGGSFTSHSTTNLKDLNKETPDPTPNPDPGPVDPTDVGPGPVLSTIKGWDSVSAPPGSRVFPRPEPTGEDLELPDTIIESHVAASPNGFNTGREGAPNHFVIHWAGGFNLPSVLTTLSGVNGAPTTNYVIKDSQLVSMVDERDTPWTNGRWMSNTYSVTVEICNDGHPTGKPSEQSHITAAFLLARTAVRWNFREPLELGVNVFGHDEVSKSPTACPGDTDLAYIVDLANQILAGDFPDEDDDETPTPGPQPIPEDLIPAINSLKLSIDKLDDTLNSIFKTSRGDN